MRYPGIDDGSALDLGATPMGKTRIDSDEWLSDTSLDFHGVLSCVQIGGRREGRGLYAYFGNGLSQELFGFLPRSPKMVEDSLMCSADARNWH